MNSMLLVDFMAFLPDIVLVVVMLLFFVAGWKKGFVRSLLGLVTLIGSIVLAFVLCKWGAQLLSNLGLTEFIAKKLESSFTGGENAAIWNTVASTENISALLGQTGVPTFLTNLIANTVLAVFPIPEGVTLAGYVAPVFASYIVLAISFVLIFILALIAFKIVGKLLTSLFEKIPLIGTINKLLGGILSLAICVLIIYVILYVAGMFSFLSFIQKYIEQSYICGFLSKYNLIGTLLNYIMKSGFLDKIGLGGLIGSGSPSGTSLIAAAVL